MTTVSLNKEKFVNGYLVIAKRLIDKETENFVVSPFCIHIATVLCASGSTHAHLLKYLKTGRVEHHDPFISYYIQTVADGCRFGGPQLSTLYLKPAIVQNQALVFAHAVSFIGEWSEKFDANLTTDADFHLLNDTCVRAPFMTSPCKQLVGAFDGFKVLKLPYSVGLDRRRVSMYIYLPDARDGLLSLMERICSEPGFVERHLPHEEAVTLDEFRIPKFKIDLELEVSRAMKDVVVVQPVERDMGEVLDFSTVGKILHRARVAVNEVGTVAEAETVLGAAASACPVMDEKPAGLRFVANHPFVFIIREDTSRILLFVGQLLDPLAMHFDSRIGQRRC